MITDPISDMLTRIRNASAIGKTETIFPFSKVKFSIAKILEKEGYISKAEEVEDGFKMIKVSLKYEKEKSVIKKIERVSKPGRRLYVKKEELPIVLNNYGIAIISTSQGLMTNKEAKKQGVGGEVVCEIY